jgi:pyruvate dehydrogenase E2 component (dihydrolipoamide acetyltransferase)
MPKEIYMPVLGMNQESGVLLRWLKAEGDAVRQGEPLMEIATDKTEVEIEAPASGVLANVTVAEGDEIPVGQVMAWILSPGESAPAKAAAGPVAPTAPLSRPTTGSPPAAPTSPLAARVAAEHGVDLSLVKPGSGRIQKEDVLAYIASQQAASPEKTAGGPVLASPKARRLAKERGLELIDMQGSGPDGAVLAADVLAALAAPAKPAAAPPPAKAEPQTIPMPRMWKVMAERLSQSWSAAPHFFLTREVDAGQLMAWRDLAQQRATVKITYTDLLVRVTAAALDKHPRLNAAWQEGVILANDEVNMGIAVAVEDGLLVPVIHRAERLELAEIAVKRSALAARAQSGSLTLDDLSGGTFTISNLGMFGVDSFRAIVNPPQAAILAVGRIVERVTPVQGQPVVRPTLTLTLSCDHRVVDGARAARFLETLADFIEEPLRLL